MITKTLVCRNIPRILPLVLRSLRINMVPVRNFNKCFKPPQLNHYTSEYTSNTCIPRTYSTEVNPTDMIVDYDHVKKATSSPDVLIVDVREPDEVKEYGKIPNSINIPLGNVTPVLSTMPDKDFKQTFNRTKPSEDTEIIFYCMIGKRSGMAQQNAFNIGYKNVKNYVGSWNDWATKAQ